MNEDAKNIKENSLTELLADSVDEPYTPRSARKEINAEPDEIDETLAHSAAHPQPVEVEPATPALDETRIYPAVAEKADVLDSESEPTQEFSPVRAQAEKFDAAAFGDGETDEDDEDDDADETTKKHGFSLFGKRKKQHADADIDEDEIASAEDADEDAEEEPSDIDSRHFDYDDYDEEENDDNEDDDEDYDEGMTFGQNVLAFLKGLTMIALVLSIVVLGVNLLGEQGIISTAWLRSNLGGVGTTLFPETTVNNVAVQPEATIMPEETAEVPAVVITDAPVPTIAPAAVDTQAPVTATEAPTSTEEAPIAVN